MCTGVVGKCACERNDFVCYRSSEPSHTNVSHSSDHVGLVHVCQNNVCISSSAAKYDKLSLFLERWTINTDGIHIRTSDYMQAGGFVNEDMEFGSFQMKIHEAFSGDDVTQQFKVVEEKYLKSDVKKKVSQGALPGKL